MIHDILIHDAMSGTRVHVCMYSKGERVGCLFGQQFIVSFIVRENEKTVSSIISK